MSSKKHSVCGVFLRTVKGLSHKKVRQSLFLYSDGEFPVNFLISLLKWLMSEYPDAIAASVTEYIFDSSSSFANIILRLFMYLIGEIP